MDNDAMQFLQDPKLYIRIREDLDFLIVGEHRPKMMAYLIATSRKQPLGSTLACTVKAGSSAGKSHLTSSIMKLMPEDEVLDITNLSAKAPFYYGEHYLEHKLIRICEKRGCASADYAIRNLISEPYITSNTVVKADGTGNFPAEREQLCVRRTRRQSDVLWRLHSGKQRTGAGAGVSGGRGFRQLWHGG